MEFGPKTTWDLGVAVAFFAALGAVARPQYIAAIGFNGDLWASLVKDFCSVSVGVIGAMLIRSTGGIARPK